MAESEERESRTEEPTEKRINDALEKGNVPISPEVITFGSIIGIFLCLKLIAPWSARGLAADLAYLFSNVGNTRLENRGDITILLSQIGITIAWSILPVLALLAGTTMIAA